MFDKLREPRDSNSTRPSNAWVPAYFAAHDPGRTAQGLVVKKRFPRRAQDDAVERLGQADALFFMPPKRRAAALWYGASNANPAPTNPRRIAARLKLSSHSRCEQTRELHDDIAGFLHCSAGIDV